MAFYRYNVHTNALVEISDFPLSPGDDEAVSEVEGLTKQVLETEYRWENGSFTNAPSRILTKKDFLKRVSPYEYTQIKTAAAANTYVDYYWQLFMLAEHIDLDDPDTIGGITMLSQAGLIAPERVPVILGG